MSRGVLRIAYVLLGLMTALSFGGPWLIGATLKGGARPGWPPDRPVEWVAFAGVTALVVAVLIGLGVIWLMSLAGLRREQRARAEAARPEADRSAP